VAILFCGLDAWYFNTGSSHDIHFTTVNYEGIGVAELFKIGGGYDQAFIFHSGFNGHCPLCSAINRLSGWSG